MSSGVERVCDTFEFVIIESDTVVRNILLCPVTMGVLFSPGNLYLQADSYGAGAKGLSRNRIHLFGAYLNGCQGYVQTFGWNLRFSGKAEKLLEKTHGALA